MLKKPKEKKICPVCRKEIKAPECYWKSYNACSACIRKVVLKNREEIQENSIIEPYDIWREKMRPKKHLL